MIPKKIHFCWLGRGKYPERVRQCMESWREILPGYEIVRWDEYKDVAQELDEGIRIHPSPTIAAYAEKAAPESYAIHHCLGSWRPAAPRRKKRWYSRWWKSTMRGLGLHK